MKVAVSPRIYMGRCQKVMKKRLPQPVKPRSLKAGFHLVKDTTSKPTLTFAQPIQPEGWITRKGGMRPVEG